MNKTPELIAHLNTLGVADVELKNNNVVKIHFQQGVSQKTWSKKELTDICAAFCAGVEASKLQPDFSEGGYKEPSKSKLQTSGVRLQLNQTLNLHQWSV